MKIKKAAHVVRPLLEVPIDRENLYAMRASRQDILELAAMLVGVKPVFLLGRGFDDENWLKSVKRTAARAGAVMIQDTGWNIDYSSLEVPEWYRKLRLGHERMTYMVGAPGLVSKIREVSGRGWVTPPEEASLLGYPLCCVEDYHRRMVVMADVFFRGAMIMAKGDQTEARRLIETDAQVPIEGELALRMKEANTFRPCSFTSVHMCAACAASDRSPAAALSKQYAKLAGRLDARLFEELNQACRLEAEKVRSESNAPRPWPTC